MLLSYILTVKKRQRPPKLTDLMDKVREAVADGYHEARKDTFEEPYNAWNYAIRGKTLDQRDLRVVVSFDDSGMLIITTIEVHT